LQQCNARRLSIIRRAPEKNLAWHTVWADRLTGQSCV
jgi:hypothetical protein